MSDSAELLDGSKEHVKPRWTHERERRVWQRVERRTQARRRGAVYALGVTLCAVVLFFVVRPGHPVATERGEAPTAAPTLRLADGTEVASLTQDARVEAVDAEPGVTALRLVSGSARFDVTHRRGRRFRVLAGDAVVEVLGTRFVVDLRAKGTHVSVERGRVRVSWPGGERTLGRGDSVSTDQEKRLAAPVETRIEDGPAEMSPPGSEPGPAVRVPPVPGTPTSVASWKRHARAGEYAEALEDLSDGSGAVKNDPEELLLAADVARLGGQPGRAVPWLRRVVEQHSSDSRAPLAAFTLGKTLLDQMGRPREAAAAFRRARSLAPSGALAEDALAREVESWVRAGEPELAKTRGAEYLRLYPDGRRRRAVMRHTIAP